MDSSQEFTHFARVNRGMNRKKFIWFDLAHSIENLGGLRYPAQKNKRQASNLARPFGF